MNTNLRKLVFSAMFLALCMVLPFLTMQIPEIGSMLSPMHFPVLLCGFVCGPVCGAVVGLIAPILRSLLFGMPPLFPTATAMAMEMLFYGGMTGLMHLIMPRKSWALWVSLAISMPGWTRDVGIYHVPADGHKALPLHDDGVPLGRVHQGVAGHRLPARADSAADDGAGQGRSDEGRKEISMKHVLVSACLLGMPCRYDGRSRPAALTELSRAAALVPFCPEIYGGLPTPRRPRSGTASA